MFKFFKGRGGNQRNVGKFRKCKFKVRGIGVADIYKILISVFTGLLHLLLYQTYARITIKGGRP